MKQSFLSLLLIVTSGLFLSAQVNDGALMCAHAKSNSHTHHVYKDLHIGAAHRFDVLEYQLEADFYHCYTEPWPNDFYATVNVEIKIDSTLNKIELDAIQESLDILNVKGPVAGFVHDEDILEIALLKQQQAGDTIMLSIDYYHKDVEDHAFYANEGFVFTDCEPQRARRWFPCRDVPNDKARWQLRARVPEGVLLGSNGTLTDSLLVNDTLFYHWTSIHPLPTYLAVVSSSKNWQLDIMDWEKPDGGGTIPIRYYYNPGEDPTYIQGIYGEMSDFFSGIFGIYPFEKNGFATLNSDFPWGGMENQTLSGLCPNCWFENLVAHEFAHHWFGDLITCGTWADLWLNEGFATYSEALWREHTAGSEAYEQMMQSRKNNYMNGNPGWPISMPYWAEMPPPQSVLFNYSITYAKSACVLYMLRKELGDETFFNFVKSYGTDPEFMYKAITTAEFVEKVNAFTGGEYNWFFDQWIYQRNHPHYQNIFYIMQEGDQWRVNFTTHQSQETAFFALPLEIRFTGPKLDTTVRVLNEEDMQSWDFHFDHKVNEVRFDPENKIYLKEVMEIVDIDEKEREFSASLMPNPANERSSLHLLTQKPEQINIRILNIYGGIIYHSTEELPTAGAHQIELNTANFPSGIFVLSIESPTFALNKKLYIVH